jgi:hypothetical protein
VLVSPIDYLPERVEAAMLEVAQRVGAADDGFAAFERTNGPWASPEDARRAWGEMRDRG